MSEDIRVAVIGAGNCASALIQGVHYYSKVDAAAAGSGITYPSVGGYEAKHIKFAAAWDVDSRKVGVELNKAIFAPPNCCYVIDKSVADVPSTVVRMAPAMDGVAPHMEAFEPASRSFRVSDAAPDSRDAIIAVLKEQRVDVLVNYLPVGSQAASEWWAEIALEARVPFLK